MDADRHGGGKALGPGPLGVTVTLVAAHDEGRGIGRSGAIPWSHPADMRRFRTVTMGGVVVVGRATLTSLGRPLPGRELRVVTSDASTPPHAAIPFRTLRDAVRDPEGRDVYLCGGEAIYGEGLDLASVAHLTVVPGRHGCDRHFPRLGPDWLLVKVEDGPEGLRYETWSRVSAVRSRARPAPRGVRPCPRVR